MARSLVIGMVFLASLTATLASDLDPALDALERRDYEAARRLLTPLAEAGAPEAQHILGMMALTGITGERDLAAATRWFDLAAAAGHAGAMQSLGSLALAVEDYATALEWFRAASAGGDVEAEKNLGIMHQFGLGVEKNVTEATRLFRHAAEAGNTGAMQALANLYGTGEEVAEDLVLAFRWMHSAADRGDTQAQARLAFMYLSGEGVEPSDVEAHRWLLLSSSAGDPATREAIEQHSALLSEDQINEAKALAREWTPFEGTVEDSLARADTAMAGSAKRSAEELEQLLGSAWKEHFPDLPDPSDGSMDRRLAEEGDAGAQFRVARSYEVGVGVEQDEAQAFRWYRKAAEQGHYEAEAALGQLYESGRGVERDPAAAVGWYRRSAEDGFPPAQHELGLMYAGGRGTERNLPEAYKWLRIAAESGFEDAEHALAPLIEKLAPGPIEESERLALEYLEQAETLRWPVFDESTIQSVADQPGVIPPERIEERPAVYPELARLGRFEARIVLNTVIDADGRVRVESVADCLTTESSGLARWRQLVPGGGMCSLFEDSARAAVSQWRFRPATKDGAPIEVSNPIVVSFRLR